MILCLDVALKNTGWAILTNSGKLRDCGIIKNPARSKKSGMLVATYNANCATNIATQLQILVKKYKVRTVVAELPTGGAKSSPAMRGMALSTGAVAASLRIMGLEPEQTIWTTPRAGKIAACNDPQASKDDVINAMQRLYQADLDQLNIAFTDKNDYEHVADALAAYQSTIR
jgi:hypothetical protein